MKIHISKILKHIQANLQSQGLDFDTIRNAVKSINRSGTDKVVFNEYWETFKSIDVRSSIITYYGVIITYNYVEGTPVTDVLFYMGTEKTPYYALMEQIKEAQERSIYARIDIEGFIGVDIHITKESPIEESPATKDVYITLYKNPTISLTSSLF